MAGVSVNYANHMLDAILGQGFTAPSNIWFALCLVQPTSIMTGSMLTEPSHTDYNGYQRVAVANNATSFPNAQGGQKSNGIAIDFPESLGTGSVLAGWFALTDDPLAGNVIMFGDLTPSVAISVGDTPSFPVGSLIFTES